MYGVSSKASTLVEQQSQQILQDSIVLKTDQAAEQNSPELNLNYAAIDTKALFLRSMRVDSKDQKLILPKDIFSRRNISAYLNSIITLTLENNGIAKIPENSFDSLRSLKKLSLKFNKLEDIPKNLFVELPALETIDLGFNHLKTLSKNQFASQAALTSLNIEHQKSSGFFNNTYFTLQPETLIPLASLIKLNLDENPRLKISDKAFESLSNLKSLEIRNVNNLGKILKSNPEFLLQFSQLQTIKISSNLLKKFPQLPASIKHVEATDCRFEELKPEDLANNQSIEYLNISCNLMHLPTKETLPPSLTRYINDLTIIDNLQFGSADQPHQAALN